MTYGEPMYHKIYRELLTRIKNNEYTTEQQLPSESELCTIFNVSRITAKRALDMLRDDGFIVRYRGKGSFVRPHHLHQSVAEIKLYPSLGFVLPSFSDSFGTYLIGGVEDGCRQAGYSLYLRISGHDMTEESNAISTLIQTGAQGLLLMPQHNHYYNPDVLRLVLDGYPIVVIDREMQGISIPHVGYNNFEASREMVRKLLELNHRNIGFISSDVLSASSLKLRLSGFKTAFFDFRLLWNESLQLTSLLSTMPDNFSDEQYRKDKLAIRCFIINHPEITAIFATEYKIATMILETLEELNIHVPDQMSLVSFDGPPEGGGDRFLTRMIQPETQIGYRSAQTLNSLILKEPVEMKTLMSGIFLQGKSISNLPT